MLHDRSFIPSDAGVVSIVVRCQVGDPQRAREVDVVDSHAEAGWDGASVFLPRDVQRSISGHDHAWYKDTLTDGETLKLKRLDVGRHCRRRKKIETACHFSLQFLNHLNSLNFVQVLSFLFQSNPTIAELSGGT